MQCVSVLPLEMFGKLVICCEMFGLVWKLGDLFGIVGTCLGKQLEI